MRKPKPPRPPMCFYRSFADYILGRISPSLLFRYAIDVRMTEIVGNEITGELVKAKKYFDKMEKYKIDTILWKIENRTATKEEYKWYAREKRKREE